MNRALSVFVISLCIVTWAAAADDAVRAAQERLEKEGFYSGNAHGDYDSDTAAAVSRYQIRHGLRISGQLDADTLNALGINEPPPAVAPANSEAWRQMRSSDPRFLERLQGKKAGESVPDAAQAGYSSIVVLSPERLRDYVGAFILAGLDAKVGAELEFFAEQVRYYDQGTLDREKIRRDLERYNQRWPERRFWLDGEVKVAPLADSRLEVTFPLRYELRNGAKTSTGKVIKTLTVEVAGEDLQIVGVTERKA